MYHFGHNLASLGVVVHVSHPNPCCRPLGAFARDTFAGGTRLALQATAVTGGAIEDPSS